MEERKGRKGEKGKCEREKNRRAIDKEVKNRWDEEKKDRMRDKWAKEGERERL